MRVLRYSTPGAVLVLLSTCAWSQVLGEVEITDGAPLFGNDVVGLGDIDGDGIPDCAGGAVAGGIFGEGQFTTLFLNSDGTVKSQNTISGLDLTIPPTVFSSFGVALGSPGDLDGDGVSEIYGGASGFFNGTETLGAIWAIFLNADGSIKSDQIITEGMGGFTGDLGAGERFGASIDALGDVDGDGVCDLAVGASADDDGGLATGAIWILFLKPDGSVKSQQKISTLQGGFGGNPTLGFGLDVAGIGDIDGNGVPDVAVGEGLQPDTGAVWILLLKSDGTVLSSNKIAKGEGGFSGWLEDGSFFGQSLASVGDRDGNGVPDIAVGDSIDDTGGQLLGAVWLLFLGSSGEVIAHEKIATGLGGFGATLNNFAGFGSAIDSIGDVDGDGSDDLLVGARGDSKAFVLFTEQGLHASAIPYPGTAVNPDCFASVNTPQLGTTWTAELDVSGHPGATFSLLHARGLRLDPPVTVNAGEILVDIFNSPLILNQMIVTTGSIDTFFNPVPNDAALLGFPLSVQGVILGGGAETCRAIDLLIGN